MQHRFSLDTTRPAKLFACPSCGKKTFKRYLDNEKQEYLPEHVGRCNREINCGYHYPPKKYFEDNPGHSTRTRFPLRAECGAIDFRSAKAERLTLSLSIAKHPDLIGKGVRMPATHSASKAIDFFPIDLFKQSLTHPFENNLTQFLLHQFGKEVTTGLIRNYFIASCKHWQGANIFWQVDDKGRVRTGKVMLYNPGTGKRIKQPRTYFTWAHTLTQPPDFAYQQCLFGAHLLMKEKTKPVALVESEKTAIIASAFLPGFVWCSTGSLKGFTGEKCRCLHGRRVVLFPDISKPKPGQPTAFEQWAEKAKQFSGIAHFTVSDLLELNTTEEEKQQGLDIADYLIRVKAPFHKDIPFLKEMECLPDKREKENEITVLENFFKTIKVPKREIRLKNGLPVDNAAEWTRLNLMWARWNVPSSKRAVETLKEIRAWVEVK